MRVERVAVDIRGIYKAVSSLKRGDVGFGNRSGTEFSFCGSYGFIQSVASLFHAGNGEIFRRWKSLCLVNLHFAKVERYARGLRRGEGPHAARPAVHRAFHHEAQVFVICPEVDYGRREMSERHPDGEVVFCGGHVDYLCPQGGVGRSGAFCKFVVVGAVDCYVVRCVAIRGVVASGELKGDFRHRFVERKLQVVPPVATPERQAGRGVTRAVPRGVENRRGGAVDEVFVGRAVARALRVGAYLVFARYERLVIIGFVARGACAVEHERHFLGKEGLLSLVRKPVDDGLVG